MANTMLEVKAIGFRDAAGRFARRSVMLETEQRSESRVLGEEITEMLRAAAPKKSGLFAAGLDYRLDYTDIGTTITFFAGGEHAFLLPFITEGTREHIIPKGGAAAQMAKGYPLRFYWEKGPRGPGIYRFWSVHHPGTKPNPFVQRVLTAARPKMVKSLNRVATRVAWLKK